MMGRAFSPRRSVWLCDPDRWPISANLSGGFCPNPHKIVILSGAEGSAVLSVSINGCLKHEPWSSQEQKTTKAPLQICLLCRKTSPGKVRGTADPSAALGMTKGRAALSSALETPRINRRSPFDFAQGRLSTSLRSGRDDNSYLGTGCECPRKIAIPKNHKLSG